MRQVRRVRAEPAGVCVRPRPIAARRDTSPALKNLPASSRDGRRRGLVQRDADRSARRTRRLIRWRAARDDASPRAGARHPRAYRRTRVPTVEPEPSQPLGQRIRVSAVHALARCAQPIGSVVDRVHRRHHRQQHLRRADVAGRLVATDVLLAGLQRQAQRRVRRWRLCDTPTIRPGIWRLCASRVARNAACGPPKPIGTPKRWDDPTTMSAPQRAGRLSAGSAPAGRWPRPPSPSARARARDSRR